VKNLSRLALVGLAFTAVQSALAQATFTPVVARYTLDSTGPYNFTFVPNSANMTVDIFPVAPAFKVGDSTPYSSGTGLIIYDVTSTIPIMGIDLVVQGQVNEWGQVNFTELAEDSSGVIGIVNGSIKGSMHAGGTDGAFSRVVRLNFDRAVTNFRVKKMFDIDLAGQMTPSVSIAAVSLVEQNLVPVPEPATLLGLAAGASALVASRRRRRI